MKKEGLIGKQHKGSKSVTFHLMLETLCLSALQKAFKLFIKPEKGRYKNRWKNTDTLWGSSILRTEACQNATLKYGMIPLKF